MIKCWIFTVLQEWADCKIPAAEVPKNSCTTNTTVDVHPVLLSFINLPITYCFVQILLQSHTLNDLSGWKAKLMQPSLVYKLPVCGWANKSKWEITSTWCILCAAQLLNLIIQLSIREHRQEENFASLH